MIFILRKVWILFVVAMVLAPCLVEGFDFVGREMFPKRMDGLPVLGKLLAEESHEFKEVWMATIVFNSFFGWLKYGNQLLANSGKIVFGFNKAFASDVPILEGDNKDSANKTNESRYDWCFHVSMALLFAVVGWFLFFEILFGDDIRKHNVKAQPRRSNGVGWSDLLAKSLDLFF
jgi:hypothetical protein